MILSILRIRRSREAARRDGKRGNAVVPRAPLRAGHAIVRFSYLRWSQGRLRTIATSRPSRVRKHRRSRAKYLFEMCARKYGGAAARGGCLLRLPCASARTANVCCVPTWFEASRVSVCGRRKVARLQGPGMPRAVRLFNVASVSSCPRLTRRWLTELTLVQTHSYGQSPRADWPVSRAAGPIRIVAAAGDTSRQ